MAGDRAKGLALQQEYSEKRQRALNRRDEDKIAKVIARITAFADSRGIRLDALRRGNKVGWEVIYDRINLTIRECELTINLDAEAWFANDNQYATYATTYERFVAVGDSGKRALPSSYNKDKSAVVEPANIRLAADDLVTLPQKWSKKSILHPQRARLYKAMSATDGTHRNKLSKTTIGAKSAYEIVNQSFNPYSKQVFAALNYGKRVHGSSTQYGFSYLSLKPSLKLNAIYFPGDTFGVAFASGGTATPTEKQCTYHTLGAILANCHPDMAHDIFQSCYDGLVCAETKRADLLLEAHLFEEVVMAQHVEELVLSRRTENGDLPADVWDAVKMNARAWARRNNARLILLSA